MIQAFSCEEIFRRSVEIIKFPVNNPDLIPTVLPLIFGVVVIELYFGRYEKEDLGWNSAVANSTMLITAATILIYERLYRSIQLANGLEVAFGILIVGLFILAMDFYHAWPEKVAYGVSSALPLYYVVYMSIVITYGNVSLDKLTILSSTLLFLLLLGIFKWIEKAIEPADEEDVIEKIKALREGKKD